MKNNRRNILLQNESTSDYTEIILQINFTKITQSSFSFLVFNLISNYQ